MSNKAKIYLYKAGNECSSVSGGWETPSGGTYNGSSTGTITFEKRSDCMYTRVVANSATGHWYNQHNNSAVKFTNFNKIYLDADIGHSDQYARMYITIKDGEKKVIDGCSYTLAASTDLPRQTFEFNIESVSSGYVCCSTSTVWSGKWGEFILYNCYMTSQNDVISITNQTEDTIVINLNKFDYMTFTKIDILANGNVIQSYSENLTNIVYNFDKTKLNVGYNEISIQATYTQGNNIYDTVDLTSDTLCYKDPGVEDIVNISDQNDAGLVVNTNNVNGLVSVNQVDILTNGRIIQSYTENLDSITYEFDETIMDWGYNEISIQVTYIANNETRMGILISDIMYHREVILEELDPIVDLPSTSTLKDIMQRFSVIESTNKSISNNLKALLISKGFEVGDTPRLSNMVKLVNELSNNNSAEITEYINRITALEEDNDAINEKINLLTTAFNKFGKNINSNMSTTELQSALNTSTTIIIQGSSNTLATGNNTSSVGPGVTSATVTLTVPALPSGMFVSATVSCKCHCAYTGGVGSTSGYFYVHHYSSTGALKNTLLNGYLGANNDGVSKSFRVGNLAQGDTIRYYVVGGSSSNYVYYISNMKITYSTETLK